MTQSRSFKYPHSPTLTYIGLPNDVGIKTTHEPLPNLGLYKVDINVGECVVFNVMLR